MGSLCLGLIVVSILSICSRSVQANSDLRHFDEVYVRHISGRPKRSTEQQDGGEKAFRFPDRMSFSFTINRKKLRLDLKLNKKQESHVRMQVVTENGFSVVNDESVRDYAYYQIINDKTHAAVRVRCPGFTFPCHLEGHFYFDGQDYEIEPDHNKPKLSTQVSHKVYKLIQNDNYNFDYDTITEAVEKKVRKAEEKESSTRHKRQASDINLQVELEMVIDYSIYNFWNSRLGTTASEALSTIREYYEQVANNMDARYSSLNLQQMTVDIVPLEITVVNVSSGNPWISNNLRIEPVGVVVDVRQALNSFRSWVLGNKAQLSDFDAIMAFTKEDLASYNASDLLVENGEFNLGLATLLELNGQPITAVCGTGFDGNFLAISIVEDLSVGDVSRTAAHELAHNMGVRHDGQLGCSDLDQFVMASGRYSSLLTASTATHPWRFSGCSQQVIEFTMNRLLNDSRLANMISCLENNSYAVSEYERILNSRLLGEIYSYDDQCKLAFGEASSRCIIPSLNRAEEDLCWEGILCVIPGTRSCRALDVMQGSTCGTGRCYEGECVANLPTNAPPTTSTAPTTSTVTPTSTTQTTTTPTATTTTSTTTEPTTTSTTTTTTPTTTTTTPTITTTTPIITTTTTPTTTTSILTTTTTMPTTTTTTTPTTTTTTPTTTTITPTTTATTPTTTTTTTTTLTTTTTTPTPTTTARTTTSTTTSTAPTTTTTTPTTTMSPSTRAPTTTTSQTTTTTTTTPSTTTTTSTSTATPTTTSTSSTTSSPTTTTMPTTTTTTPSSTTSTTTPTTRAPFCDWFCQFRRWLYRRYGIIIRG